jgi:hypothetical protein
MERPKGKEISMTDIRRKAEIDSYMSDILDISTGYDCHKMLSSVGRPVEQYRDNGPFLDNRPLTA